MKAIVAHALSAALENLPEIGDALADLAIFDTIERTRDEKHGDFASNIALRLAKAAGKPPRELATAMTASLTEGNDDIARVEIAGPGFINFFLDDRAFHREVESILDTRGDYGRQPQKERPRILLESVSANPTGPLHVGHGRLAAFGATVGNLLEAAGYPVHREYYVNDAGRQMDILGVSVWLRALEAADLAIPFPAAGYKGEYIRTIAAKLPNELPPVSAEDVLQGLPADGSGDAEREAKEAYVEALVVRARLLLGEDGFDAIRQYSLEAIRADIEEDLAEFGVTYDCWYSEQSLEKTGRIDAALAVLEERGMLYRKDGATWFPATRFGDEKDRVVIRDNGVKTYFASDIAYHFDKRERGFDLLIDILGADHHGYVPRVRAGLEAMGYAADDLEVELVQFVTLYRAGKKMQMSTRSGEFDTLRQLCKEVGKDAARLFYVMRSNDQHLDFDLDVAKSQSNDNPVYYIQYAHARIARVFAKLADEFSLSFDQAAGIRSLALLAEAHEKTLMSSLSRYPEIVDTAASNRAPQILVHYLKDLAGDFHSWYNEHRFIEVDDPLLRAARLTLAKAASVVLANGLGILGVSAPEKM
ncbi:MAG: arginine--tRNA ligase [Pseudomonadota bacterium]